MIRSAFGGARLRASVTTATRVYHKTVESASSSSTTLARTLASTQNSEYGGWHVMGAAAAASAALAMVTTLCDAAPEESASQQQPQVKIRRLTTRTGVKDPMTSYQQNVERRVDPANSKVGILQDPMTTYQKHAMDQAKTPATETEEAPKVEQEPAQTPALGFDQNSQAFQQQLKQLEPEEQQQVLQMLNSLPLATSPQEDDRKAAASEARAVNIRGFPTEMTPSEARLEESARLHKSHSGGIKVFSGNGNMALALEITRHLGISLGKATVGRFADGECNIVIKENVRGKDVYVVQPTCPPVNDNLMELLLMVSTLRRASARRITVVIPYYGYARQDRKMQARVPISAADVARLMEAIGVDRVIAVDLHCGQIQGFFGPRVPVDNLDGGIVGLDYFGSKDLHNPVIVSPDAGGVYRAKKFKEGLQQKYDLQDLGLAMIVKQRARAGTVDQMDLVGDVKGCDCIIVDDMIDTAGTLCKAADVLKANGASRVFAFASHGLLSGPGNERIAASQMEEVVVLNTIPTSPQREANEKLTELSVASLLAQAIFNIHAKKSISALFK